VKIILVGASGTLGQKISVALSEAGHEIVKIGRKSGDVQADFAGSGGLAEIYKAMSHVVPGGLKSEAAEARHVHLA
jgi:putative NADH-flavin reductase